MTLSAGSRASRLKGHGAHPALLAAVTYGALTAVALGIGWVRGAPNVFLCRPSHAFETAIAAHLVSLGLGLVLAVLVATATRVLVRTRSWASALHEDLRPFARALGGEAVIVVALASAIGEETLFRGALQPWIGLVASSVLFGVLHQMRGRSRVAWWLFATLVGLAFGAIFRFTGSLLGAIVAHATINAVNLRFLIAHDPQRMPSLGGLLGPPPSARAGKARSEGQR